MGTHYENAWMNDVISNVLNSPPVNADGSRITGASHRVAFWKGYDGKPFKHCHGARYSVVHAYWAAGKCFRKQ